MTDEIMDGVEEILSDLSDVRGQTTNVTQKAQGLMLKLGRVVGGSVIPLLERAVIEFGNRTNNLDLRLQRMEAHLRLIDDGDPYAGLPVEPLEFVASLLAVSELAKQSSLYERPEVKEAVDKTQAAILEWREYLVEDLSEDTEPEEEPEPEEKA